MSTVIRAGHSLSSVRERQVTEASHLWNLREIIIAERHRRIIVPRIIRQRRPPFTLARVSMTGVNYQQVDTEYSVGYGMGLHVRGILPLKPLSILGKLS